MAKYSTEKITSVKHWNETLFSFTTTRNKSLRFRNGHFLMIGLEVEGKPLVRAYSVASPNYEEHLSSILTYHESESPIAHKKKFELIKGDATVTFENYLKVKPHTIVALAYFDFDLYYPTKVCLELLMKRVTKGSVIVFDELNCPEFPGETLAVLETFGLNKYAIKRSPLNPLISYIIID